MDEILTSEQVAQILQIHPFTVLKFIKQGKLKASKLGRVYRIRKSDVEKFLDNQIEQQSAKESSKATKNTSTKEKLEKKIDSDLAEVEEIKKEEQKVIDLPSEKKDEINGNNQQDPENISHYTLKL